MSETGQVRELSGNGGGVGGLTKAAMASIPGVKALPGVRKVAPRDFAGLTYQRHGVTIDPQHVAAYAAVCGFPKKDTVPVTYPHMLAFPLHLALMADPAFAWPAMGTVHLGNQITAHRAITAADVVDVSTFVGAPLAHPKGTLLEFVTTITSGDETVWESVSSYLRRGKPIEGAPAHSPVFAPVAAGPGAVWSLPGDLGRSYARVSGDINPIHLYPLTAKALGFPRQIAHGMWSKARCVAAIENRLPDAVQIDVGFRNPILLPSKVSFGLASHGEGWDFSLRRANSDKVHLLGSARPLS